ncbi:ABC transporter permease [Desulfuromonas carbonis]|uniref:ABC transporter permease n=1 Tax=Desulfuromonas sp. DDH964 TaxID=1823759 RepID=UPI00078EDB26|nr:FtsX-like permease family protein [Desulfuromonas sp. DDH964]AMV72241.1 ABC transporter membrane protein [Desulfuromonas sp. DDH964]
MQLNTIAWNNLRRRKGRLIFLVAGLLLGVATVVTLMSLVAALTAEAEHKLEKFGANILLTPRSDSLSLSYGGIELGGVTVAAHDIAEVDLARIAEIPNYRNVAAVAPKVLGAVAVKGEQVLLMGVDPAVEFNLKRWWSVTGEPLHAANDLVAGSAAAKRLGLAPGGEVAVGGRNFIVSGVLAETGSQDDQLLIVALPVAQQLLGKVGRLSLVEVAALCGDCPVTDMVGQLGAVLPGIEVRAIQQVVRSRMHALEQFRALSLAVAGVVVLIGGLVVFVTMMNSVAERTREIGIFRAIGFRRWHIIRILLFEALVVGLLAGVLGYLAGIGVTWLALPFFGGHHGPSWDPALAAGSVLLALVVGGVAALYPAWQASTLEPSEALRAL